MTVGNTISVIGPRASGKTTYLAALCYWPMLMAMQRKQSRFDVTAIGEDAELMVESATNIILQGESLEPTQKGMEVTLLKNYLFEIKLRQALGSVRRISLNTKDYPGEIFEDIANNNNSELQQDYVGECLSAEVKGCLILFSDWDDKDGFYCRVMSNFIAQMDAYDRMQNLRLAIVMSKCERGELWPGRHEPELDLFQTHLPQTAGIVRNRLSPKNVEFFALSTFGVLGRYDPRPNRVSDVGKYGRRASLRAPKRWRPYGLIEPLYWLDTGKKLRRNYV